MGRIRSLLAVTAVALLVAATTASPVQTPAHSQRQGPTQRQAHAHGKASSQNGSDSDERYSPLPYGVLPTAYNLSIVPFLDDEAGGFPYQGTVDIRLSLRRDMSAITLHSKGLEISEEATTVKDDAGNELEIVFPLVMVVEEDFLTVNLSQPLVEGDTYTLHLQFSGKLNVDMEGFYRSSYQEDGITKWMATTHMKPEHARRAFPCFDSPGMKATFNVRVGRKESEVALSNMPRVGEPSLPDSSIGGRVWDTFVPTEPMSTYLVAFSVSEFESVTADADAMFRVWARRDAMAQTQYALEVGPLLVAGLEQLIGMDRGVPKVDNVAVSDLAPDAMESWGHITYRESSLLYQAGVSTEADKQRVATSMAHALALFWFGNRVTPALWSSTWLSEGIATYFQAIAADMVLPEWEILDQFVVDTVQSAMRIDSLVSTFAMGQDAESPAERDNLLGKISRDKGASVHRMMDHVFTRPTFLKGLLSYLEEYQYENSAPYELFLKLQDAADEDGILLPDDVENVFITWYSEPGHPFLRVASLADDKTKLVVTQERVLLAPDPLGPNETLWYVPLTWTRQSDSAAQARDTQPMAWLREKDALLHVDLTPGEWIVFNKQQVGLYRVAYDSYFWPLLITALDDATERPKIHETNRAQIIDDALHLARCGFVDYEQALESTLFLRQEVAYLPWVAAFNAFDFLESRLIDLDGFDDFKSYVLLSMDSLYTQLTFDGEAGESQKTVLSRVNALKWACKYGLQDCVDRALTEFADWVATPTARVEPNKKYVVYCTALREGPEENWDFLWQQYLSATLAADQSTILSALGCTKLQNVLVDYLLKSLTEDSGIRRQDAVKVFMAVYSNPEGVDLALDFLVKNLPAINSHYLGTNTLSEAIVGLGARLNTLAQVDKLKLFTAQNALLLNATSALVGAETAIETAEADLEWASAHAQTVLDWVGRHTPSAVGVRLAAPPVGGTLWAWLARGW